MCGLTGIYALEPQAPWNSEEISSVILRMTATLTNRGPDATGQVIAPPVAFGHRRLSILDLSVAGAQPMRLNDSGPMITFNGEIYNFRELRYELTARKVVLRNSQRDRLPADILDGPKTGFGVPYENWLCTSLYDFACAHLLDARFWTALR